MPDNKPKDKGDTPASVQPRQEEKVIQSAADVMSEAGSC